MNEPISRERLRELLDAYGADPARWPEHERDAARRAIDASAQARQWFDDALAADAELALPEVPAPSVALRAAILASAPGRDAASTPASPWWRELAAALGGWRFAASALTVAAVAGVWVAAQVQITSSEPDLLEVAQLQANDLEY